LHGKALAIETAPSVQHSRPDTALRNVQDSRPDTVSARVDPATARRMTVIELRSITVNFPTAGASKR